MSPVDGSFDSASEVATALLGPLSSRRLVLVRARDAGGSWGPVRGVFTPDPACVATLTPPGRSFGPAGGAARVAVRLPSRCKWTATSNDTWVTIMAGASGTGNGTVTYSVASNPGANSRTAALVIASRNFTLTQSAAQPGSDR